MNNLCTKYIIILSFFMFNGQSQKMLENRLFVDLGVFAGGFKGKEKYECGDIGFVGRTGDVLYKGNAGGDGIADEADLTELHGQCSSDCISIERTKTKLQYGFTGGVYFLLDDTFALGIEGFSEWHDVQYQDGNADFDCKEEDCRKQKSRYQYEYDENGKLNIIDPDNTTNTGYCSLFAPSERVWDCIPVLKVLKHHSYGALMAMKFYTSGGESFVKLGIGLGQLVLKNPVGVAHKDGEAGNEESYPHKYIIKKIKCRKGFAWEAAIGTRITSNIYAGFTYMGQRNLTEKKDVVYTNHRVGFGLSIDFGR